MYLVHPEHPPSGLEARRFDNRLQALRWITFRAANGSLLERRAQPVAINEPISDATELPRPRDYYAAQGNASRLFFRDERPGWPEGWEVFHRDAFSAFHYLLSGGFSRPAMYPAQLLGVLRRVDDTLSRRPRLFAARCLVGLKPR